MHICYIDESGTSDIPGNTSHFVLAGLAIPGYHWKDCEREITDVKRRYDLVGEELHTAWLLRRYQQQRAIPDFESLGRADRTSGVRRKRNEHLLRLQREGNSVKYKRTRKNYRKTSGYVHLTETERRDFVSEVADCVAGWGFARLFAECIDKLHFDPEKASSSVDEQAFEQVVSRFEMYLKSAKIQTGLIVHDNNETTAKKHTNLMRRFHEHGTLFTRLDKIIETPLFVDSSLTSMVQIADLCSYAIRRYLENQETDLFDKIYQRADRKGSVVVGIRHFADRSCNCSICRNHKSDNSINRP